jgi:hypothetical protein
VTQGQPAPDDIKRRDDEIADEIICRLRPGETDNVWKLAFVIPKIRELRRKVIASPEPPRPSDAEKLNDQIELHARALLAYMERLSPNWRAAYARMKFFPLIPDPLYDTAFGRTTLRTGVSDKARMNEWLYYLKQLTDTQEIHAFDPFNPKDLCVDAADEIIQMLAPETKLTKTDGSLFYLISSWLWEAVSGERNKSLKRYCDIYIDTVKWFGRRPAD